MNIKLPNFTKAFLSSSKGRKLEAYNYKNKESQGKDSKNGEKSAIDVQRSMICGNMNFAASEAYKLLRANLLFTLPDNKCRVVGVTSSTRGEGKSMTAINLSYTIAQARKKVLLIDADMRIPSVARRLDIKRMPGLSNVLAGQKSAALSIQKSGVLSGFDVLVAGDIPPNPSELLSSSMMDRMLDELSHEYDFIIIDLPPVNLVSDAIVISSRINGLIMVVRENFTSQIELREAVGKLEFLDSKILGFCMTDADDMGTGYKRYRGRYKKYYKYGKYRKYSGYRKNEKYGYSNNYYSQNDYSQNAGTEEKK